jgi:hypothetical protein
MNSYEHIFINPRPFYGDIILDLHKTIIKESLTRNEIVNIKSFFLDMGIKFLATKESNCEVEAFMVICFNFCLHYMRIMNIAKRMDYHGVAEAIHIVNAFNIIAEEIETSLDMSTLFTNLKNYINQPNEVGANEKFFPEPFFPIVMSKIEYVLATGPIDNKDISLMENYIKRVGVTVQIQGNSKIKQKASTIITYCLVSEIFEFYKASYSNKLTVNELIQSFNLLKIAIIENEAFMAVYNKLYLSLQAN